MTQVSLMSCHGLRITGLPGGGIHCDARWCKEWEIFTLETHGGKIDDMDKQINENKAKIEEMEKNFQERIQEQLQEKDERIAILQKELEKEKRERANDKREIMRIVTQLKASIDGYG